MGVLIKANFKNKLNPKLYKFNLKNTRPKYHAEIFSEMFSSLPQFKAHVAAYLERNYCVVVNDDEHSDPGTLLDILKPDEVRTLNEWIINRNHLPTEAG